jgi:SOS-response transcriptional repressor LexA
VNLQGLIRRELAEGLTEEELAFTIGVEVPMITRTLTDGPQDPAVLEKCARYFRIHADFLRYGGPLPPEGVYELEERGDPSPLGEMRKVPLLKWNQIDQIVTRDEPPRLIQADALLETNASGKRTFAVQVKDDSMQPLFGEGEVMFVNPDLATKPGDYVLIESEDGRPERALLRQLQHIDGQALLHPLNRRYLDLPVLPCQRILGRVVQLRKNL